MADNLEKFTDWEAYLNEKFHNRRYVYLLIKDVKSLLEADLPIVINFEHLSNLLGLKKQILGGLINSTELFYRTFYIPKRRGGKRKIEAPYPMLLEVQRWILENILNKIPVSDVVHGFVNERSVVTHAQQHLNNEFLLKLDLENFFPSINKDQVINLFIDLGYSRKVSYLLGSICTLHEALPQGAPTSPSISNILLKDMDESILSLAGSFSLRYTRYADDLAFSGAEVSHDFLNLLTEIIEGSGFLINSEKTQLKNSKSRKILTGIEISNNKLSIPRAQKRKLRQELHYIFKFGILTHMTYQKVMDPIYLERLLGKLTFWGHVDPECNYVKNAIVKVNELRKLGLSGEIEVN